jgi:hypothetical protein
MKRLLSVLLLVLAVTGLVSGARASILFTENFDYDAGVLADSAGQANVSGGVWTHFSGGGLLIECVDGNLTYPTYAPSNIGRMVRIVRHTLGTTAEDVYRQFTTQATGVTLYTSFLFKVTHDSMSPDTSTHGQYFAMLMPSSSTTSHFGRICTKMGSTAGKFKFGLRATSSNTSTLWTSGEYDVNTTYLVLMAYGFIAGNTNDVASLWINPSLAGSQPAPDLTQTSALTTDPTDVARLSLRQGSTSSNSTVTPSADIDGIQVATSWTDLTGITGQPDRNDLPVVLALKASPNPAGSRTQISFNLPAAAEAELSVFNIAGQKVATLAQGPMTAGAHAVEWKTGNVPNGVYFYQLQTGSRSVSQKILVVK